MFVGGEQAWRWVFPEVWRAGGIGLGFHIWTLPTTQVDGKTTRDSIPKYTRTIVMIWIVSHSHNSRHYRFHRTPGSRYITQN